MNPHRHAALCSLAMLGCNPIQSTPLQGGSVPTVSTTQVSRVEPQTLASRLAFGAGRLAQLTADSFVVWDLGSWTSQAFSLQSPKGIGTAADGALVAIDQPTPGSPRVTVLDPGASNPRTYQGFFSIAFASLSRVSGGAAPGEIVLATPGPQASQSRLRLKPDGSLSTEAFLSLQTDQARCWTGLGDGSALSFWSDALLVQRPGAEPRKVALLSDLRPLRHLAPGPDAQAWATTAGGELVLLKLADAATAAQRFRPDGGLLYHLGASGDTAAVLLVHDTPAAGAQRWALVVYGSTGERWRTEISRPNNVSDTFVAVGQGFVAVGGGSALQVWRVEDGSAVALK